MIDVKLRLDYDARDELFLQFLYEGYEMSYWVQQDDLRKYNSDPKRYAYMVEQLEQNVDTLKAYEHLAGHYTALDKHLTKLKAIRDRIDAKHRISTMGDKLV